MQICTPFKSLVWAYYRIYILLSTVGLWRYLVFRTSIRKALLWMWWINIVMQEIVSSLFNALFIHAENSQCIKNTFLESKEFNTMVLSYSHTTLFGTQRRCLLPWKWPRKSCTKRHTLLAILRYVSQVSKKTIEKKLLHCEIMKLKIHKSKLQTLYSKHNYFRSETDNEGITVYDGAQMTLRTSNSLTICRLMLTLMFLVQQPVADFNGGPLVQWLKRSLQRKSSVSSRCRVFDIYCILVQVFIV